MNRLLDRLWRWVDALVRPIASLYDRTQQVIAERLQATLRTGLDQPTLDNASYERELRRAVAEYQQWLRRLVRDLNVRVTGTTGQAFATLRADLNVSFPRSYEGELVRLLTDTHHRYRATEPNLRRTMQRILDTNPQTPAERKRAVDRILTAAERDGHGLWVYDSKGRRTRLDHYARRVVDGYAANVALKTYQDAMRARGLDLVTVSTNETTCPKCAPWQGRTLSLNGLTQGHPTLAQARAQGLFHISCRHGLAPTTP